MFNAFLYALALLLVALSWRRSPQKTRAALKKSWKSFENILPLFSFILIFTGIMLTWLDESAVRALLGSESGWSGLCLAAAAGSATLIPAFVAYPMAGSLLHAGAGYAQVTMFITTLMLVGIATLPLEKRYFGRFAYCRNGMGLVYSVLLALAMGWIFA